jgi:hypothetical protein
LKQIPTDMHSTSWFRLIISTSSAKLLQAPP